MTPWNGPLNWAALSHPQLYHAATVDNEPAEAYELGRDWAALGADMIDQAQALAGRIGAGEEGWLGEAGESVRAATLALTRWCGDAGASALGVGECVTEQAAAAEATKLRMPEPAEIDRDAALGVLARGDDPLWAVSDLRELSERARTALERAVAVMTELERWSARIEGEIPSCPAPPATAGGDAGSAARAGTLPGSSPAVPAGGGDGRTAPAAMTGGAAGATGPDLAGFGGTGGAEGRAAGTGPLTAGPAVLSRRVPVASTPVDGGRADVPAQGGAGGGRGQFGAGGPGGPGVLGGGAGAGAGQSGEHRTPRFLGGEKVFDPLPAVPSVIGDTWTAEWSADPDEGRRGRW